MAYHKIAVKLVAGGWPSSQYSSLIPQYYSSSSRSLRLRRKARQEKRFLCFYRAFAPSREPFFISRPLRLRRQVAKKRTKTARKRGTMAYHTVKLVSRGLAPSQYSSLIPQYFFILTPAALKTHFLCF